MTVFLHALLVLALLGSSAARADCEQVLRSFDLAALGGGVDGNAAQEAREMLLGDDAFLRHDPCTEAYVRTRLRWRAIDVYRQRGRRASVIASLQSTSTAHLTDPEAEFVVAEAQASEDQRNQRIWDELSRTLSEDQFRVFQLRHAGLTPVRIAELLTEQGHEVTRGQVRQWLSRARQVVQRSRYVAQLARNEDVTARPARNPHRQSEIARAERRARLLTSLDRVRGAEARLMNVLGGPDGMIGFEMRITGTDEAQSGWHLVPLEPSPGVPFQEAAIAFQRSGDVWIAFCINYDAAIPPIGERFAVSRSGVDAQMRRRAARVSASSTPQQISNAQRAIWGRSIAMGRLWH